MAAHVDIWPTGDKWYFHRVANNGKITDDYQGYASRSNARRAVKKRWPGIRIDVHEGNPNG